MTIFECWNSFYDFPGPNYDDWTKCPHFFMVGTTFRGLGCPKNVRFWPEIVILAISGSSWQLPQMGCTLVKLVWTLYFISGTAIWVFFAPMKMSLVGPRRPKKDQFWPSIAILAISGSTCLEWVQHWSNWVQHCISCESVVNIHMFRLLNMYNSSQ